MEIERSVRFGEDDSWLPKNSTIFFFLGERVTRTASPWRILGRRRTSSHKKSHRCVSNRACTVASSVGVHSHHILCVCVGLRRGGTPDASDAVLFLQHHGGSHMESIQRGQESRVLGEGCDRSIGLASHVLSPDASDACDGRRRHYDIFEQGPRARRVWDGVYVQQPDGARGQLRVVAARCAMS